MKTIYLSGPMSGLPDFNRPAFFVAEQQLAACMNVNFINPARINGTETKGWEWSDYMRVALRGMMDADAIYMLDGWENSKGACLELHIAMQLGMQVMYQPETLVDWYGLERMGMLILDTETTGLGKDAEIIEIAVIDQHGNVLLDSLVKPVGEIPSEVSQIHGITDEVVEGAPGWDVVGKQLLDLLGDYPTHELVIWNADYDLRLIRQTDAITGEFTHARDLRLDGSPHHPAICAQMDYSRRIGERRYNGKIKRQSLANTCRQLGIQQDSSKAHRALYDCQITLQVIKEMLERKMGEGVVV